MARPRRGRRLSRSTVTETLNLSPCPRNAQVARSLQRKHDHDSKFKIVSPFFSPFFNSTSRRLFFRDAEADRFFVKKTSLFSFLREIRFVVNRVFFFSFSFLLEERETTTNNLSREIIIGETT